MSSALDKRDLDIEKTCKSLPPDTPTFHHMCLKQELETLGEELPPAELLPAKRKEQSLDATKRNASRKEFGRRALAGGNM